MSDIISIDIYDRELGVADTDLLPIYKQRIKQFVAQNSDIPAGPNPAAGDGLSLPVNAYVGRYVNDEWGVVEFNVADDELAADCGDLHLQLHTAGQDQFDGLIVPGMVSHGEFAVEGDSVVAVEMETIDGQSARFVRDAGCRVGCFVGSLYPRCWIRMTDQLAKQS